MTEIFNSYIEHIEADFWRELCLNEGELRHYERGMEFARAGEVAPYIGYIKSGILKYVARSGDGTEHVIGLEFEHEFVADFPFSLYGQPAKASIITVAPSDIYCVPSKVIRSRMETDCRMRDIIMQSTVAIFSTVYDRYKSLYSKTPQQRYEELINLHSDLFMKFPLKDIASFLNITPTHLSRLRKNNGQ